MVTRQVVQACPPFSSGWEPHNLSSHSHGRGTGTCSGPLCVEKKLEPDSTSPELPANRRDDCLAAAQDLDAERIRIAVADVVVSDVECDGSAPVNDKRMSCLQTNHCTWQPGVVWRHLPAHLASKLAQYAAPG